MSQKKAKAASTDQEKLSLWQERLAQSDAVWKDKVSEMDNREALVKGSNSITALVSGDSQTTTSHVRNIIFENIESQISSSIPMPKVSAYRKEDERLAQIAENYIRNELDRMPFEMMNDMAERVVPTQGGVLFLVEWDNTKRTYATIGELVVSVIHPKQLAPQPGIYTDIEDMDWFIIKFPTTKAAVLREYGIDISNEGESEPEVRGSGNQDNSEDSVTKYIGYERNEDGLINKYVWVNDTELENLTNYQARRMPICTKCGRIQPYVGQPIVVNDGTQQQMSPQEQMAGFQMATQLADQVMNPGMPQDENAVGGLTLTAGAEPELPKYDGGPCPWCGNSEWTTQEMEWEEVIVPVQTQQGTQIPGAHMEIDPETQMAVEVPTQIPYYRPDIYPVVLQRSVSQYGQLLGNSDVDMIKDQQNTLNRMSQKIIDRLLKAGTRVTLPSDPRFSIDPNDSETWRVDDPALKNLIDRYEFSGNLQYEMAFTSQVYEEARQILGITDSFQGRHDPTAVSGTAKQYAAAMAAGRLESKRMMKNAAYAKIFEMMFKFLLAYSDEPRTVAYKNHKGDTVYEEFNRYDFLVQDATGQWHYNDRFLFSVDTTTPLAANREALWQETRQNLQSGAFGEPASTETLILFWGKMEELHYPGAASTKKFLEEKLESQQQAMAAAPAVPGMNGNPMVPGMGGGQEVPTVQAAVPEPTGQMPVM